MRKSAKIGCALGGLTVVAPIAAIVLFLSLAAESCSVNLGPVSVGSVDGGHGDCGNRGPLKRPPSPRYFGTTREICTWGDDANPGAVYGARYAHDKDTQERDLGQPARLSGYTTWIDHVALVPARSLVDGYTGWYVRVDARVFNRDANMQQVDPTQFSLWRRDQGYRAADYVGAAGALRHVTDLGSGFVDSGRLWFYAGDARGELFVRWFPNDGSPSSGVWLVAVDGRPVTAKASNPSSSRA